MAVNFIGSPYIRPQDSLVKATTLTAKGDIFVATASGVVTRLAVGTNNYALVADSAQATGVKWAVPTDSTKIPLSTVTTKGDLLVATASATVARQAVGANNKILIADSTQTNGIKWGDLPVNSLITAAKEGLTVSATAATGNINLDFNTTAGTYYTTAASGNFTLNLRGNSTTTLASTLAVGESATYVFLATNATTAYYATAISVDGTALVKGTNLFWLGGTAPTSGNTSSIDAYTILVIKTGASSFAAFASVSKFA